MRVLITGASGFVGRQCYRILKERGHEVIGLCHKNNQENPDLIPLNLLSFHKSEIRNMIGKINADTLLHTAWYISPNYRNSSENLKWISASLDLVDYFYEAGGKRVMTLGTCFEDTWNDIKYTSLSWEDHKTLDKPICPHTLYGVSKLSMYRLLDRLAEINKLNYVHARLFYLFGPNEAYERLVPSVARSLLNNEIVECSNGNHLRDFMCVEDVADALVTTLEQPNLTGLIDIGSGKLISIKELIKMISLYLNKINKINYTVDVGNDPATILADTKRLNKEVGWNPKYTLEEGLAKTLEWLKKNYKG